MSQHISAPNKRKKKEKEKKDRSRLGYDIFKNGTESTPILTGGHKFIRQSSSMEILTTERPLPNGDNLMVKK